ncbi:MAG: hypothetical protein M3310_02590 [Actinomycetota bacterium]|nr:hypothetical protein [Actinomycetota bacterium]
MTRSKWFTPAAAVAIGLLILAAQWAGGSAKDGLYSLAVMVGFGLLVLLGGRSETIRGLRGDGRDERFELIDLRAMAYAGLALVIVLVGVWLVELARGDDGAPYGQLLAVGGVAYVAALAVLRFRS